MKNALKRATKKKSFKDLSGGQKLRVVVTAAVQIALQTAALRDLKKRPTALVNGPKPGMVRGVVYQFFGP